MQLNIKMESRFYSKAKSDSSIFIFLYRIYNWFTNKAKEKKTYEKKNKQTFSCLINRRYGNVDGLHVAMAAHQQTTHKRKALMIR